MTHAPGGVPPEDPAGWAVEPPEEQPGGEPSGRRRLRPQRGFWHRNGRRVVVGIAGFGLVIVGIILALPLVPGPGALVIIAGLALLATEFEWAERWLHRARRRFDATARSAGLNPRVAGWIVVALLVVGAAVGAAIWLAFR